MERANSPAANDTPSFSSRTSRGNLVSPQQQFFQAFTGQLAQAGYSAEASARFVWRPFDPGHEAMLGPDRKTQLNHLACDAHTVESAMQAASSEVKRVDHAFFADSKIALILLPGFTHETLRHYSWHEVIDNRDSEHNITVLHPGSGGTTREEQRSRGGGLPVAYVHYPRSNASTEIIVPGVAQLLRESATVQRWCEEGRQLVFVGYSNGAPITLELLAALNQGALDAGGVLESTRAFLALAGDVGGAYLADDVISDAPAFISIRKVIEFANRHPIVARLIGLGTKQLREDMWDGVRSLGHAVRQSAIASYRDQLPAHLHYLSVAAMLPLADYRRHWWQFNLDDWSMYRQALISDPITVYNDGQVALADNLIPPLPHVPETQQQFLGAVRTHHWGVSYRTFNLGNNLFPRSAFYKALLQVISTRLERN